VTGYSVTVMPPDRVARGLDARMADLFDETKRS
jgi:hypothetical protein